MLVKEEGKCQQEKKNINFDVESTSNNHEPCWRKQYAWDDLELKTSEESEEEVHKEHSEDLDRLKVVINIRKERKEGSLLKL